MQCNGSLQKVYTKLYGNYSPTVKGRTLGVGGGGHGSPTTFIRKQYFLHKGCIPHKGVVPYFGVALHIRSQCAAPECVLNYSQLHQLVTISCFRYYSTEYPTTGFQEVQRKRPRIH